MKAGKLRAILLRESKTVGQLIKVAARALPGLLLQIPRVDICDFQLTAPRRFDLRGKANDLIVKKTNACET